MDQNIWKWQLPVKLVQNPKEYCRNSPSNFEDETKGKDRRTELIYHPQNEFFFCVMQRMYNSVISFNIGSRERSIELSTIVSNSNDTKVRKSEIF
jgi:hypothetical protein